MKKIKTLKAIVKLDYDYIILDLGAGTAFNTLDFFLASRNGIFITTPEPTSIENVYRLMRAIYLRRIRHYFSAADFRTLEKRSGNTWARSHSTSRKISFRSSRKNFRKNTR